MEDLQKYKKVSLDFRRVSSNMFRTTYDDGLLYLIRFRDFILKSEVIQEILFDLWSDISESNDDFISEDEGTGWKNFNIPVDEAKHLKLSYDYLNGIIEQEVDLTGITFSFRLTSSRKFNDNIQAFLKKAFKPLVDYINDELSQKIMELSGQYKDMTQITQNIENNYGTASAIGSGSISSVNNTSSNDLAEINKLCIEILNELSLTNSISEDDKEIISDDIEVIQSELCSDKPKSIKLKKVWTSIQGVISNIPVGVSAANLLLDLGERISGMF